MVPYGEYLVLARERRKSVGMSESEEPSVEETTIAGEECLC